MNKKKVLFISDHLLSTSGVATQARYLVNGLIATGKYQFFCFGAAMKHENHDIVKVNDDLIIKPINGFGDKNLIRTALLQVKPDVLFLFTDPRFFEHIWHMEDEIHQFCPVVYWTIWDAFPLPVFNKSIYQSCDLLNCINDIAYKSVTTLLPDYAAAGQVNYVPHGVPADLFFPMPTTEAQAWKNKILGPARSNHFVMLFVSRNARRKMPNDILIAWKMFLDELQNKHGHKNATFLMHTDPRDFEGPNLHATIEMLGIQDHVLFSKDKTGFNEMRIIYNISDFVINVSAAEGFGLSVLEGKMCGKPAVALKTGGLTRQIENHVTQEQYGVAVEPEVQACVGNQAIPFIFEDMASHKTYANAIMKMYELGQDGRAAIGARAMEHARKEYDMIDMIKKWEQTLDTTLDKWTNKVLPNNTRYVQVTL